MSGQQTNQAFEVDQSNNDDDLMLLRSRSRLGTVVRYPPPKTTLAAMIMLFAGIALLISGLVVYFQNYEGNDRGLPIFILGGIMFIPGSYASYIIYGAWRGWSGFNYNMIPSYDD